MKKTDHGYWAVIMAFDHLPDKKIDTAEAKKLVAEFSSLGHGALSISYFQAFKLLTFE